MKIIAIGFLMLSQLVFSQNDIQTIREQNPGASNREVLKIFYNDSHQAAELNDFDKAENAKSNHECRMVHHSTEDNLNSVAIRRMSKVFPGNGPLFPSKTEDKLTIAGTYFFDGTFNERLMRDFDFISIDENAYDLQCI